MRRTLAGPQWYREVYLTSMRWRLLRALRRLLDGGRCRRCGARRRLETHHRSYAHRGAPGLGGLAAELADLATLCAACHREEHRKTHT